MTAVGTFADTVILAGRVHTLAPDRSPGRGPEDVDAVTAIGIIAGTIAMVGTQDQASSWADEFTTVIDLGDATLTPGLVDAHTHPVMGLDIARGADLNGYATLEGAMAALATHATTLEAGAWVMGWGLDPNVFGTTVMSNAPIHAAIGDRPTYITLFDSHSAVVSQSALSQAGIDGARSFTDASSIGIDDMGQPTGFLFESSAMALVQKVMPAESFSQRVERLYSLLGDMAANGLTGSHVMDLQPDTLALLDEIERTRELPIRLRVSPMVHAGYSEKVLTELVDLQTRHGRRWAVGGVKLMIDGTIDNGTAWLYEPDNRGESTGPLWLDTHQFVRAITYFHDRKIPTATHAIGDNGIDFVAETLAALAPNGTQHRIEHLETLPDDVLETIIRGNIAASMQPTHCTHYVAADHSDNWSHRLGTVRANRAWRTRDLKNAGAILALGSDWPIAPFNPREIMADAQLRRPAGRLLEPKILPEQALTALQALEGFTTEVAAAIGSTGGFIAVGQPADVSAFSIDPLVGDPDVFAESVVLLTMVAGVVTSGAHVKNNHSS